jgi:hypothetical protein
MDGHQSLGMRLSSKMFLSSALVIVVLTSVSALSLGAVGRLVSVNRETTTHTIPAMSLTASARDAIPRLVALEARAVVLGDQRYSAAWSEMARRVTEDLDRLAELPLSELETRHRLVASAAFQEYWSIVDEEQALLQRGDRGGALWIIDTMSGARAEEVREAARDSVHHAAGDAYCPPAPFLRAVQSSEAAAASQNAPASSTDAHATV